MEKVDLLLDGVNSEHAALLIDCDMLKAADQDLAEIDYLLWLEDNTGRRLRGGVAISGQRLDGQPEQPLLVKIFPRGAALNPLGREGILVSEATSELFFDDGRARLELCQRGVGPLALLVFKRNAMYWETPVGDGVLAIGAPALFGEVPLIASGPRLRASALV